MSRVSCAPDESVGELISGASVRWIARAKALARTGVPSLKRKSLRSVNV